MQDGRGAGSANREAPLKQGKGGERKGRAEAARKLNATMRLGCQHEGKMALILGLVRGVRRPL